MNRFWGWMIKMLSLQGFYRKAFPVRYPQGRWGGRIPAPLFRGCLIGAGIRIASPRFSQNLPFTVVLARATAESAKQAPRVANVIATVANMCCGMVQRRLYR